MSLGITSKMDRKTRKNWSLRIQKHSHVVLGCPWFVSGDSQELSTKVLNAKFILESNFLSQIFLNPRLLLSWVQQDGGNAPRGSAVFCIGGWKGADLTLVLWCLLSSAGTISAASPTLHPHWQAGMGKILGGDIARTANSHWLQGYSMLYDVCSAIKSKRKEKRREHLFYCASVCLQEWPLHVLKPCFLGSRWTSPLLLVGRGE